MTLQDGMNKIRIFGHVGPHGVYNFVVFERLSSAVLPFARGSLQYRRALRTTLATMRVEVRDSGSTLGALIRAEAKHAEVIHFNEQSKLAALSMGL